MNQKKKADIAVSPSHDKTKHIKKQKPLKIERTLELLITKPMANAFDAQETYGDLHLNTSVSDLQLRFGFRIRRQYKKVPGRATEQQLAHYWLDDENRSRAIDLLNQFRAKRNVSPVYWGVSNDG